MAKKLIEWSDMYSVGYEDIDNQHKKLVELINQMFSAFAEGKADEILTPIIDELVNYTKYHFDLEEKYFYKYNYPDTDKHVELHQGFITSIINFKDADNKKKGNTQYEVFNYIKKWLVDHILGADMEYSIFFKKLKINQL